MITILTEKDRQEFERIKTMIQVGHPGARRAVVDLLVLMKIIEPHERARFY